MPSIRSEFSSWGRLAASAILTASLATSNLRSEPARWFMPGPLGYEPGSTPPKPAEQAYLSRAMYGADRFDQGEWARHNRLTASLAFSHNLANIFPPNLVSSHPEYFPLVSGVRLHPSSSGGTVYWNPDLGRSDVAAQAAQAARDEFAIHPQAESFAIGINDGLIFGESQETLALVTPAKWFRGRPDYSNLVFTFANRAAVDLARTHPQKYLGTLAYYWAEDAPDFAVHPQVIPFLTADRSQGYDASFRREEYRLQNRWAGAGSRRLGLYDYLYGGGFLIPRIHPHLIADNLRHARRAGFTDYFAEVNPNWGSDGPMPWLVAQLLQDPEQPVDGLLDEYYRRYFQEAAEPMRRFYTLCEAQWMNQSGASYWLKHFRNESQATLFPSGVCQKLRGLINDADRAASSDNVRQRVKLVSDALGVTERFVRMDEARAVLSVRAQRNELRGVEGAVEIVRYLDARRDFITDAHKIGREQPLAFSPVTFDDFLRNDPTFGAILSCAAATANPREWEEACATLKARPEISVATALESAGKLRDGDGREILPNGTLEGPVKPGRTIAGLHYGVDLPEPWRSQVEPTQNHAASITSAAAHSGSQGLRISGAENTTVFQWLPATAGNLYVASVRTRASISPSDTVTLTLGWLDDQQRHIGTVVVARIPDGQWPDWIELRQGARAPVNAKWAGIGIRVQHQTGADWAEFDDFSLVEFNEPKK